LSSHLITKIKDSNTQNFNFASYTVYECKTWSLTLREEYRLRVFENRALRRIFEPRREDNGSWRKLHNDELHGLYSLPNGTCGMHDGEEGCLQGIGWNAQREDLGIGGRVTLRWTLRRKGLMG
jgi:hypothetical protein